MTDSTLPPEWVLRGAAAMVLRQHGSECLRHCLEREEAMIAVGDETGAEAWRRIFGLAAELVFPQGEA